MLKEHRSNIEAIHRTVGLSLQVECERTGTTDSHLTTAQFRSLVGARLRSEGYEGKDLEDLNDAIIEAASQRLVFLVGLEEDRVGFEIRSLQEYMAAEALMDGDDNLVQARLQAIAGSDNWRNVFLFAAGKCFTDRQHLRDTIVSTCLLMNNVPGDEASTYLRVGSELALSLLEEGIARQQPNYEAALCRCALDLVHVDDMGNHRRLAGAFSEKLHPLYEDAIRKYLDSGNSELRSSAVAMVVALVDGGHSSFDAIAEGVFAAGCLDDAGVFERCCYMSTGRSWIGELLLESAKSQSFERVMSTGVFNIGFPQRPWMAEANSPWFVELEACINARGTESSLFVMLSDGWRFLARLALPLRKVSFIDGTSVASFLEEEFTGKGWALVQSVVQFAANPSTRSLSDALVAAADESEDLEITSWLLRTFASWPLLLMHASGRLPTERTY